LPAFACRERDAQSKDEGEPRMRAPGNSITPDGNPVQWLFGEPRPGASAPR